MTFRLAGPGVAWALVALLVVIAVAVAVVSLRGAPPTHVWHAHVLPAYWGPVPVPHR